MAEAEVPAENTTGCPISADFLPVDKRKHVDVAAPMPLRMMAAKGLVPVAPAETLGLLFMLMYDPDEKIRDTAGLTASKLPDRIAASAFRDEGVQPMVLGWFLTVFARNDAYAEMLILNGVTPDDAVAAVANGCSKKIAEIIGQNQLRILRHDNIIRELSKNPETTGALIDGVCDFAVRSGLHLPDVEPMMAARVRVFGAEKAVVAPVDHGPTAEQVMKEFGMDLPAAEDGAAPMEDGKRLTLTQRIMAMNVAEKIKLATKGNKEARGALFRESNKLVLVATIRSPRITDGEVLSQAQNKAANEDVLRVICANREWLRKYAVKLALVKNPKVPQGISMRLLTQIHETDVKNLARDKMVPGIIQTMAKKHLEKKNTPKKAE
jgi:hypothetical protein